MILGRWIDLLMNTRSAGHLSIIMLLNPEMKWDRANEVVLRTKPWVIEIEDRAKQQ